MNLKSFLSSALGACGLLLIAGCASSPKALIVETESGILQSVGTAKEEPDARMQALNEAQEFCEKQKSRSIFQDKDLKAQPKKEGLQLNRLPVIGQAFKGEDRTQVILSFRCAGPSKAE